MRIESLIISRWINVIALLLILTVVAPAYSAPKPKVVDKSPGGPVEVLPDQECGKGVVGKGDSKCGPKETGTVKSKVVKKAGAAAAVGVAGKKIPAVIKD